MIKFVGGANKENMIMNPFRRLAMAQMWNTGVKRFPSLLTFIFENIQLISLVCSSVLTLADPQQGDELSARFYSLVTSVNTFPTDYTKNQLTIPLALTLTCIFSAINLLFLSFQLIFPRSNTGFFQTVLDFYTRFLFYPLVLAVFEMIKVNFGQPDSINHVGQFIGSLLTLSVLYGTALFGAFFRFDTFRTIDPNSSWNSAPNVCSVSIKGIAAPLLVYSSERNIFTWMLLVALFLLCGIRAYVVYQQTPFLNKWAMYIQFSLTLGLFGVTTVGLIALLTGVQSIPLSDIVYAILSIGTLAGAFACNTFQKLLSQNYEVHKGNLQKENPFRVLMLYVESLEKTKVYLDGDSEKLSGIGDIYAMQIISEHSETCISKACLCHYLCGEIEDLNIRYHMIQSMYADLKGSIIRDLLRNLIQRHPKNINLKLYWAHYEYLNEKRTKNSLFAAYSIPRYQMNLTQKMAAERLIQNLNEKILVDFKDNSSNLVDIKNYIEFQTLSGKLTDHINTATKLYLYFWEMHARSDIEARKLFEIGGNIEQNADRITMLWNDLQQKYPNPSLTLLTTYAGYMNTIRNSPYTSEKLLLSTRFLRVNEKTMTNNDNFDQYNIGDPKNMLFHVNMDRKNLGKVLKVTHNVHKFLGWKPEELVGKNINAIMAPSLARMHDSYLINYIESDSKSNLATSTKGLLKNKRGEELPAIVYISVFPQYLGQICFLGIVKFLGDYKLESESNLATLSPGKTTAKGSPKGDFLKVSLRLTASASQEKSEQLDVIAEEISDSSSVPDEKSLERQENKQYRNTIASPGMHQYITSSNRKAEIQNDKQVKQNGLANEFNDFNSSLGSTSKNNLQKKLEEAIFSVPKPKEIKNMWLVLGLVLILCLIFLFVFLSQTDSAFTLVNQYVAVINTAFQYTEKILEINTNIWRVQCVFDGTMSVDRIPPNLIAIVINFAATLQKDLSSINVELQEALSQLSTNFQQELFEANIPLPGRYIDEPTRIVDLYDYGMAFITASQEIINTPFWTIQNGNPDMRIILNNTFDGYLVASETIGPMFGTASMNQVLGLANLLLGFMVVIIILSAWVVFCYFYWEASHMKKRNEFLEMLVRINPDALREEIKLAKEFSQGYQSNKETSTFHTGRSSQKHEGKMYIKRSANLRGINSTLYFSITLVCLIATTMTSGFVTLYSVAGPTDVQSQLGDQISLNLEIIELCVDLKLVYASLPEYVTLNETTTLRNVPIVQEWENSYEKATTLQGKLVELTKRTNHQHPNLENLISGNLCSFVPDRIPGADITMCPVLASGAMTKGLVAVNSFMLATDLEVKLAFDNSEKTVTDMFNALNLEDFRTAEILDALWHANAIELLQDYMLYQLTGIISSYENEILDIVYVFIALNLGMTVIAGILLVRRMEEMRKSWRKMLRLIPQRIFRTNNMLKQYLIKNCERRLDSVKNSL